MGMKEIMKSEENRRRAKVVAFLNESGIKPTLKGYRIFMDIIPLSADEPELGCFELFDKYFIILNEIDDSEDVSMSMLNMRKRSWKTLYRDCKYALDNSKSGKAAVYDFIRSCAIRLEVSADE